MDYPSLLTNTDYVLAVHCVHIIGLHRSIKLVQEEDLVPIGKVCQMLGRRYVWCSNILIHTKEECKQLVSQVLQATCHNYSFKLILLQVSMNEWMSFSSDTISKLSKGTLY